MTERQGWLTIAEAFATPRGKRTSPEWALTLFGVCAAIDELGMSYRERRRMMKAVWDAMPGGAVIFFCPYIPANDPLRADFCYFQYYRLGGK